MFLSCPSKAEKRPKVRVLHGLQNPEFQKEKASKPVSIFFLELMTWLGMRNLLITKGSQAFQMAMKGHLQPFSLLFRILFGAL